MNEKHPDADERFAVCDSFWDKDKKSSIVYDSSEWQPACVANHIGPWMVEPCWFQRAVDAVKAGTYPVIEAAKRDERAQRLFRITDGGIAVIEIDGPLMKGESKYGGTSSVLTRRAIREAARHPDVEGIMLQIDSPGGTAAGTADLADDVRIANEAKPVFAHIDDLGASAAYWVASQGRRISAGRMAEIGSIGTVVVVEDTSEAAEEAKIRVHVVSTGEFKGAFADGAPITERHLDHLQERIDNLNIHFLQAVKQGRQMSISQVRSLADGRVHIAAKAQANGLIDAVQPFDAAMAALAREIKKSKATPRRDRMAVLVDLEKQA